MAYGTVNADVIGTSVAGSNLGAGDASIMKNRIINGAMVIDQRNAGASVTVNANQYTLDRWQVFQSATGKYSVQQNAGSVTPPVGFQKYLGCTSLSSYSVSSGDYFFFQQVIEANNMQDLAWGTANAKAVTLSFQVYSSVTGTFSGSIENYSGNRSYPFTYTVSSANTWTTISVNIAGDTTGTWTATGNSGWGSVNFDLGSGSTIRGTANAWASGNYIGATGSASIIATSGATFYITGVQLEVGSSATGYEYRQYTTELQLCQRYCYSLTNTAGGNGGISISTNWQNNTTYNVIPFPVTMRALPSMSAASASTFKTYYAGAAYTPTSIDLGNNLTTSAEVSCGFSGTPFTIGASGWLRLQSGAYLNFTAEL